MCDSHESKPWMLQPYLWPDFLQQLDGFMGEEVLPLNVPLLVRVQGVELQGCLLLLCLRHGPLELLLVHLVFVVQEVIQGQAALCRGQIGCAVPRKEGGPPSPAASRSHLGPAAWRVHTWNDLAVPQGLHQAVHLFLCQQQIEVVLGWGAEQNHEAKTWGGGSAPLYGSSGIP